MNEEQWYTSRLSRLKSALIPQEDKPEETPEATLNALILAAGGNPMSVRRAAQAEVPELDERGKTALDALLERRLAGVPLAQITRRQNFLGIDMLVGPEALIPRVETEILGRAALTCARELAERRGAVRLLDVCTGSGNVALAIAHHEPRCTAYGTDLSPEATALAIRNAQFLGLEDRVQFATGDMFGAFMSDAYFSSFDIVTCNPPYISSAKVAMMPEEISRHEPRLAFDGGSFGISLLTRLIKEAPKFLKPDSYLCFEVGVGQGPPLERMLKNSKLYRNVQTVFDEAGKVRTLVARF